MGIIIVFAGLLWAADEAFNRFSVIVTVANQTTRPIRRIEFKLGGNVAALENVPVGASVQRAVRLRGRGELVFRAYPDGFPAGIAANYLDADCDGYPVGLRFNADGTVTPF